MKKSGNATFVAVLLVALLALVPLVGCGAETTQATGGEVATTEVAQTDTEAEAAAETGAPRLSPRATRQARQSLRRPARPTRLPGSRVRDTP